MPPVPKSFNGLAALALVAAAVVSAAGAQPGPSSERDDAIFKHVQAMEASGQGTLDATLNDFDKHHFSAAFLGRTDRTERRALLSKIADAAADAGGALLDEDGAALRLTLLGPTSTVIVFEVEPSPPFAIDALRIERSDTAGPPIDLTWDNAEATFERLEKDGLSGVVYLARRNDVVLRGAYGLSNEEFGLRTQTDTIYGIGSTPIDFTVAALFLLVQDGKVKLSDLFSAYVAKVPADKASMTLEHLISGQSGLPDFHDAPGDWDADLAWIDRDEAIRRILAQPLLFAPGQGEAHSHSAYGLVAAVIEIVSGQSYFEFLRERIFAPAGMTRTGMYGDRATFGLRDFAEGRGARAVGIPNIPPNWGPTSWLIMGSGGMYSTLDDMLRFYSFVRTGERFEPPLARRWSGMFMSIGGSERGFYFFHVYRDQAAQAMLLINGEGRSPQMQALSRAVEALVMGEP